MRKQQPIPRLSELQMRTVRDVVESFLDTPVPFDTLTRLLSAAHNPNTSVFQRYCGGVLADAETKLITNSLKCRSLQLIPPGEGHLIRLHLPHQVDDQTRQALISTEDALNRIISIRDALEDGICETRKTESAASGAHDGIRELSIPQGYRSAYISLPPIGANEQASAAYFNEVDWRALDYIASNAHALFQRSLMPNMYQSIMGAWAPSASDWDIRTRLASSLLSLELPLHTQFVFDYDGTSKTAFVSFNAPLETSLPNFFANAADGVLKPVGKHKSLAVESYSLRLCCLLAACAFGAGRHIDCAVITCRDATGAQPLIVGRFSREAFVFSVLKLIDDRRISSARYRFDPDSLAACIADSCELHTAFKRENSTDKRLFTLTAASHGGRRQLHADHRDLSADMQALFLAKRICDIDTTPSKTAYDDAVQAAKSDAAESPLSAIARLEGVVDDLEDVLAREAEARKSRPLYCDNALARAQLSLLGDHFSVAADAERFLNPLLDLEADDQPAPVLFFNAPAALFDAHMGLSVLYGQLGDMSGAHAHANRCIDLAPTTAQAHYRKADALAQEGRFAEAANVIVAALRFTASERDCSLLYYHLALLLWKLGRHGEAAAVYVYMTSLKGDFKDKALRVIAALRKKRRGSIIVHASPYAASREMKRARIPVAPSDEARMLVVRAAIGLSCNDAPCAASPYAAAVQDYFNDDPVLRAACQSLQAGLAQSDPCVFDNR